MKNVKFYLDRDSGSLVEKIGGVGGAPAWDGREMEPLLPNAVEASGEKHVPAIKRSGDLLEVNVGSVDHPMAQEHYIEWVQVETDRGSYRKRLQPGAAPHVTFLLPDEKVLAVYAYCNLHGLWIANADEV